MKKKFNVYLDDKVVKEAKELGLNISKICENALRTYIRALRKSGIPMANTEDIGKLSNNKNS